MKTLFALTLLVASLSPSFATENQASECPYTLHSEERGNTKASLDDKSKEKEEVSTATGL
ncbi:MAG: hypothetical protein K2P81_04430 [Bacteriovoracaceae bacterium]|nr:hypothetical protein [Bacteriovoracaceae bacterium]